MIRTTSHTNKQTGKQPKGKKGKYEGLQPESPQTGAIFFPQADAREAKNHFQSEWAPFNGLAVPHCFLQGVRTPPLLAGLTTILSSSAVACE